MLTHFVVRVPKTGKYRLQHDVIQRMTLIVFGTIHFEKFLEFSKRKDLEGWIENSNIIKTIEFRRRYDAFTYDRREKMVAI